MWIIQLKLPWYFGVSDITKKFAVVGVSDITIELDFGSFFFFFDSSIFLLGILPREIEVAFPRESQLQQSRSTDPTVHVVCFSVFIIHRSDIDDRIFNVRTDVNACDCTRGFMGIVRESALKVGSGNKILSRTGELNLRQRRSGSTLYQLGYIPTPRW